MPAAKRTKARDKKFFDGIEAGYGVGLAARQAGYGRTSVYNYRNEDPEFAEQWDEAKENYIEELEAEADRRAIEGIEKDVYYQGRKVGTQREYSDALLMFRLKAMAPERYRDRQEVKHDGKVDSKVELADPVLNIIIDGKE